MQIEYQDLTVRLANVLKLMNITKEQDVVHIIVPSKYTRLWTYSSSATINTRVREEFLEFQTEMRFKYL